MKKIFLRSTLFVVVITGCSSVKQISEFSAGALNTLKKYEELGYTFDQSCRDRCYLEEVKSSALVTDVCDCEREETADSIASVLYKAVKGYYDGLVKLSSGNVTTYKTKALTKELKSGQFGDLKIGKAEVDAYAKLSTVLLKAFTDGYRRKKLQAYIEDANVPVQILVNALEVNLASNLTGKLKVHKARMLSIYHNFLKDSAASAYEKKKVIDEYNMQVDEADAKQEQILLFTKGLKSIRNGHQQLFDNRNKMNAKEMKVVLAEYASDMEDIISEFNKLKSK